MRCAVALPATLLQLLRELEVCGLGPDRIDPLWEAYQAAREEEEAMNAAEGGPPGAGSRQRGGEGKENQVGRDPDVCAATASTPCCWSCCSGLPGASLWSHQVSPPVAFHL